MLRLEFDIETNGLLDQLDVIHSLVIKNPDTGQMWTCHDQPRGRYHNPRGLDYLPIDEGLEMVEEADEVIGHNIIKFDIPAIQKVKPGWSPRGSVFDTLVVSRLIWSHLKEIDLGRRKKAPDFPGNLYGSHGLEAWGLRLGFPKDDYSKRMKELGIDPWAAWNPDMQVYGEIDVDVTDAFYQLILSKAYSQEALALELAFQHIIFQQEQHGFPFDVRKAQKLYAQLVQRRSEIEDTLREVFPPWWRRGGKAAEWKKDRRIWNQDDRGGVTSTRPKTVKKPKRTERGYFEVQEAGAPRTPIALTSFNPGSRDHIADRLSALRGWKPDAFGSDGKPTVDETIIDALPYPEAKKLSEYLMVQKRIGQLAEGNQACLKLVQDDGRIHGNVITNGAVTGRCTHNRPNVAQTPGVKKGPDKQILYGHAGGYGYEFRECYYAPEGFVLVGADASGLELRMLAHFMARYDGGAYARELLEGDIHKANQLAAGLPTRDNAKTFIYGFLYGAGDEKIGKIVGRGAKEGARLKRSFLKKTPALKMLREAVIAKAKDTGTLIGLDGRVLHVRSAHAALNTLLQSGGALAVKKATIILIRKLTERGYAFGVDYALVAHVHDEVQLLARKEIADEIGQLAVESFREAGEHFKLRCPLDGEYKIGHNWAETH